MTNQFQNVAILKNGEWLPVAFEYLKRGDVFRAWEYDGTPAYDAYTAYEATTDAYPDPNNTDNYIVHTKKMPTIGPMAATPSRSCTQRGLGTTVTNEQKREYIRSLINQAKGCLFLDTEIIHKTFNLEGGGYASTFYLLVNENGFFHRHWKWQFTGSHPKEDVAEFMESIRALPATNVADFYKQLSELSKSLDKPSPPLKSMPLRTVTIELAD